MDSVKDALCSTCDTWADEVQCKTAKQSGQSADMEFQGSSCSPIEEVNSDPSLYQECRRSDSRWNDLGHF